MWHIKGSGHQEWVLNNECHFNNIETLNHPLGRLEGVVSAHCWIWQWVNQDERRPGVYSTLRSKLKSLVLGKNGKPIWEKKGLLPAGKAGLSYFAIQSVIQLISLHREYFGWQAGRKEHYLQSAGLTSIVFICSASLQKALYSDCPCKRAARGRLGLPHLVFL